MNVKNNKRRKESQEKIEKAFVELLQTHELKEISVADIIRLTGLNRSTFYANYLDIYDLADKLRERFIQEFSDEFADYDYLHERTGALRMFTHVKENQLFYKTYFKICRDEHILINEIAKKRAGQEHIDTNLMYHIEFFRNGLNAILKIWLAGGCKESPEEMAEVLKQEYRGR